jgi:D-arabinose 1-dehydrogenase-like Zn-dependent alcohol dehydrogenase
MHTACTPSDSAAWRRRSCTLRENVRFSVRRQQRDGIAKSEVTERDAQDVHACGVCRTDLHLVDGELPDPKRPVIPGHEIVGTVATLGEGVSGFKPGDRVGVPWLGHTCC